MDQVKAKDRINRNSDLWHDVRWQIKKSWATIVLVLGVTAVFLGGILFLHLWKGIPIGNLTRDPVAVGQLPVYTGFLSQIGIFFWVTAVAICLFCSAVLARLVIRPRLKRFLLISALLTLLLALDELFMLHETVLPRLGIPERVVLSSYLLFFGLYFARYYRLIWRTEFLPLLMALFFFGVSLLIDQRPLTNPNLHYLVEDGTKLVGIISWMAYFFQVSLQALQRPIPIVSAKSE